jgi:hypothetical protein
MSDVSLQDYLSTIIEDHQIPEQDRNLARVALTQWERGIIPAERTLRRLSKVLEKAPPCSRLLHDGACGWIRKYGAKYELPVPPQGERALCPYLQAFSQCPGYKKMR